MSTDQMVAAGLVGGMSVVFMAIACALAVIYVVARWKLFTKAGEAGWKALIPIYSDYIQWKIGWVKTSAFWIMIILIIAASVFLSASGATVARVGAMQSSTFVVTSPLMALVGVAMMIAAAVLSLVAGYKLVKSFGGGAAMFIAYIFFPYIVLLVLAFGSAEHRGALE